jgi:dolichol-phosphate mannosyltransferase
VPQAAAAAVVLARLSRGRSRRPPLSPPEGPSPTITVLVPARDEAQRIGPCLQALAQDPAVTELIVVDDRSADATAAVARAHGARVVDGAEPPPGWVGKPWALQQGLDAATGDVVVALDADTRPRPGLAAALASALEDADLVTAGPRFVCDTAGERWLHPSFLTSLVYRFGPSDAPGPRTIANGQCTAARREPFLAAGGYAHAAGYMTDDTALAKGLERRNWRIAFRDGSRLLDVDMHASAAEVWREWGRSIALADVTPRAALAADVAVLWLTMALPLARAAARRPQPQDLVLLAVRVAMLAATAPVYARRGPAYWLSPLADPLTAARVTWSALRPPRRWRGRVYAAGGRAPR